MNLSSEHGNDIEALLAHLGNTALRYVDIQSQEAGRLALQQWPLLAKLRSAGIRDSDTALAAQSLLDRVP